MREVFRATPRGIGRIGLAGLTILSMGATQSGFAQSATPVPGAWIRFTPKGATEPVTGRLLSISGDSITIRRSDPSMSDRQIEGVAATTTPLTNVSNVEIRTWSEAHAFEGFLIGAVSGGALGVLAGQGAKPKCDGLGCVAAPAVTEAASVGLGIAGVVLGGVLGGVIGASIETEVWTPTGTRTTARLQITPRRGGLAARASFSLP